MIKIEENIPLAPLTTMKVGGPAKYYIAVASSDEIIDAIKFAQEKKLATFILGGGSNIIFSDKGFNGLVIKCDLQNVDVNDSGTITAGAGVPMEKIVLLAGERGFGGVEWAAGIPGTIGGAIRGNAGAFGGETKDIISEVSYVDFDSKEIKRVLNPDCRFGYRDSIFKHNKNIIVSAKIKLAPGQDLQQLQKIAREHLQYRVEKHPVGLPSAGSIFKNVPVGEVPQQHLDIFKESIKKDPKPVVPAAKIIAEAGLSGIKIGDAQISPKHTNYIINTGNATAADIIALIDKVKDLVKQKFGINLSPEPQIVE